MRQVDNAMEQRRITPEKIAAQGELLFNRLTKRHRHLKKWARRTGTNAFRLYDRDIPEIPLVMDLYDDAVSGAVFTQPFDNEGEWLPVMIAQAARALHIPENHIFLKERRRMRSRQESGAQYQKIAGKNFYRDIREGGLTFRVNLSDYLDTGLFLDARKKRALIRDAAAGKKVLNLFAYTCSLSVCAAKGGADAVDSVDLSNTYLEWGKVNFALNKLDAAGPFTFIKNDVFRFLSQAEKKHSRWDLIILDPPSFSNSKKMTDTLDIRRDFRELIQRCLSLLGSGGTLWFSSNARGFKLDPEDLRGLTLNDMAKKITDEDFIGKRMPACYTINLL